MNVILDIKVLAGPPRTFLNDTGGAIIKYVLVRLYYDFSETIELTEFRYDDLTDKEVNCSDPVNQYSGQKIDLG